MRALRANAIEKISGKWSRTVYDGRCKQITRFHCGIFLAGICIVYDLFSASFDRKLEQISVGPYCMNNIC